MADSATVASATQVAGGDGVVAARGGASSTPSPSGAVVAARGGASPSTPSPSGASDGDGDAEGRGEMTDHGVPPMGIIAGLGAAFAPMVSGVAGWIGGLFSNPNAPDSGSSTGRSGNHGPSSIGFGRSGPVTGRDTSSEEGPAAGTEPATGGATADDGFGHAADATGDDGNSGTHGGAHGSGNNPSSDASMSDDPSGSSAGSGDGGGSGGSGSGTMVVA